MIGKNVAVLNFFFDVKTNSDPETSRQLCVTQLTDLKNQKVTPSPKKIPQNTNKHYEIR